MSEEDFREGLPTKEQIEAHYEPGKPYGYWRRKDDPRTFRLGWHNDEVVYDSTPWLLSDRLMSVPESLCSSAWQPVDSSNSLLPWSVVEVSEYRTQIHAAQPRRHGGIEPRRFADVRPDRHGWRWWRECTYSGSLSERFETQAGRCRWMSAHSEAWFDDRQNPGLYRRTVIPTDEQGNPVSWDSIEQPAPTAAPSQPQPQGFRADLWRRMLRSFFGDGLVDTRGLSLSGITARENDRMFRFDNGSLLFNNGSLLALAGMSEAGYTDADILARWAVYQELKPLYDLVDGAQGEVPIPEDAILELARRSDWETYPREALLRRTDELQIRETGAVALARGWTWSSDDDSTCGNFAAVLDAVAEQRIAARVRQAAQPTLNGQPMPLVSFQQTLDTMNSAITRAVLGKVEAPERPGPLPRFTADELDDVDHSQSTKLDSAPLKRGKLPTAEQISKYREVMAKRSGTVTEALKASGIDCEVAQYVLERWAGGLSDIQAYGLIVAIVDRAASHVTRAAIDARARVWLTDKRPALDIAEPTDDSAQRQREEREAQRQRMAALQAQLAAERAARTAEPQPEPTRFDLLECDPKADPAASIAAWEARQKRNTVRPMPQSLPQPGHRRPFEVVDAEAGGLRPGAVFTALLGRALNPNC